MSDPCSYAVTWGGNAYVLTLNHPWTRSYLSLRGIYGANGSTPAAVLERFESRNYSPDDVERVLELGLIGGGKTRAEAETLVNDHVRLNPLAANVLAAHTLLVSLFMGEATTDGNS